MRFKIITFIFLLFLHLYCPCYASDVLFIDTSFPSSFAEQKLKLICQFYGLNLKRLFLEEGGNKNNFADNYKINEVKAIVIEEEALSNFDVQEVLSIIQNESNKKVPLLIMDVTPQTDSQLLYKWSNGAIIECTSLSGVPFNRFLHVASVKDITFQLSGQSIPFMSDNVYHFRINSKSESLSIIEIKHSNNNDFFPVFLKTSIIGKEIFFLTKIKSSNSSIESNIKYDQENIFEILPLMMFLRYTCGERCWHNVGHYANLTIDDPWLTEPYGSLSYEKLLDEMNKINFHLTVGFIPWNYDRSEPEVISIFKDHPERFSLCLHGNNHDHYEFYKYETGSTDPMPAKPLFVQESNIKQAIARMEKFRELTGLSYDRVMIFPHGIAPSKTLGLLKKYNFLATSNSSHIPLDIENSVDPLFPLRSVSLEFENFTSLKRFPARMISEVDVAINLFLDNPILLYDHVYAYSDLFANGIDAFNKTAEMINNIQPDIKWQSLGHIVQHLFLQRLREDGNYDIKAFAKNILIENIHQRDITYFVQKEESFSQPIKQVTVDGKPYPYKKSEKELILTLMVPAGESRQVDIEYKNNFNLSFIDIKKSDSSVNLLRKLSDFRDNTLSKNVLGRTFIRVYYGTNFYKLGLKRLTIFSFILSIFVVSGLWYIRFRIKKHRFK